MQFYVIAYDTARPANRAETLLLISVIRNPTTPSFADGQLEFSVFENVLIGFTINQIEASDDDGVSI